MVTVGGWIAHAAFWLLLLVGREDLGPRKVVAFVVLWLAGYFGLPLVPCVPFGGLYFMPFVALLDVVLAFLVFYYYRSPT